jgi:hypothetical protein
MGARLRKKGQKKKRQQKRERQKLPETMVEELKQEVVTIDKKNDTIAKIDFFGFSPSLFWSDLGRTAWGTLVMVVVLVGVYLVTK